MPIDNRDFDFPDEISAAFDSYSTPPLSPDFDARFWSNLEARRGRYRGFRGFLRRIWELEIEGVAVWRLGLSTLSGGAVCALFFGGFVLFVAPQETPRMASQPSPELPETPRMVFDTHSFYAREWEFVPIQPEIAPQSREKITDGGEISWNGSKNSWA